MSERNVTRAQAGALNLIENVAHGRNVSQVDRDFLWMAHCDLLAELSRLNAMLDLAAERDRALTAEVKRLNDEVAEHAIGRSIDEGDALVLALANALDAAHSPRGVPGRGPATCCDGSVCALLERARRWGQ